MLLSWKTTWEQVESLLLVELLPSIQGEIRMAPSAGQKGEIRMAPAAGQKGLARGLSVVCKVLIR